MSGEGEQLKAGHAPAIKVGGMRVAQNKPKPEEKVEPRMTPEDKEEFGDDSPVKSPSAVLVSGAKAVEEKAFPKEAVKAFHDKPTPTHHLGHSPKPKVIQQPKK